MEGIIPPVITPYNNDLSIDYEAFEFLIDHLVVSGVDAVIVGGTTGEYYLQSYEERIELIRQAQNHLNGRLPLIAGVGGIRTEDCIQLGLEAKSIGADGILISSPYYSVPTQQELAQHALQIDRAVDLPIILYNYPGRTGTNMGTEFFDLVVQSPNFRAIKESSGELSAIQMLAHQYPQLNLLCGTDDQAIDFFAWGARGWVCGAGTALPEEHIALYQACTVENNFARGRKYMKALLPFLNFLENGGKFTQSVKYACKLAGLPTGSVRPPLQPLSDLEKSQLTEIYTELKTSFSEV